MAENENMEKAKETFDTLCQMLDKRGWHYEKHEDILTIKSGVKGDDLPIEFIMRINPKNEVVSFISWLPFTVEESKRIDVALAICVANYGLSDGSFDYDLTDGEILFRLTSSFKDSALGENLFEYMLRMSATTIDAYNDKLFMVSKGAMTLQQFIDSENLE